MMKFMRGFYLIICYAIGIPMALILALIVGIYSIIKLIINGYHVDAEVIRGYAVASLDGIKQGHKINMLFVKYGRDGQNHLDELLEDQ